MIGSVEISVEEDRPQPEADGRTHQHHPRCDDDGWDHSGSCVVEPLSKLRSLRNVIARQALEGEDWKWWRLKDRLLLASEICANLDGLEGLHWRWSRGGWTRTSNGAGIEVDR